MKAHGKATLNATRTISPDDWVVIRCRASQQKELIHLTDEASPIPRASAVAAKSLLGRLLVGRSTGDIVPFQAAHGRLQLEIVDAGRVNSGSSDHAAC